MLTGLARLRAFARRADGSMIRIAALLVVITMALPVAKARAQFDSNFPPPPRPPADIPNRPPSDFSAGRPTVPFQPAPGPPPGSARGPSAIQNQALPPPPGGVAAVPRVPAPAPNANDAPPPPANPPPPQPADTSPQPDDTVVTEMPTQKIPNERAVFTGLDKITGRIINFDAAINETVQFGALQVTPRVCYTRPPTESANTDAFLEVDEVTLQGEIKRIFTGWMFASSPGLHAIEHPIYDVWLTDCKTPVAPAPVAQDTTSTPAPAPAAATPPPARQRPRQPAPQPRAAVPADPFQQR
jgi:hypothetical protein